MKKKLRNALCKRIIMYWKTIIYDIIDPITVTKSHKIRRWNSLMVCIAVWTIIKFQYE